MARTTKRRQHKPGRNKPANPIIFAQIIIGALLLAYGLGLTINAVFLDGGYFCHSTFSRAFFAPCSRPYDIIKSLEGWLLTALLGCGLLFHGIVRYIRRLKATPADPPSSP